MNKHLILAAVSVLLCNISFPQDFEGCKDPTMFPTRMPNYQISECKSNFDALEFRLAAGGTKTITKEGTRTLARYDFNAESGKAKPSALQILRNYEAAANKIGATTMFLNSNEATATFKMVKNGIDAAWISIHCGDDDNGFYEVNIIELEAMKQDITANDIFTALNTEGRISLYINFETNKSVIKPESEEIINQVADMLKSNTTLKVNVEGHTDNVGIAANNKILSEKRAKAVVAALIIKGIDKSRLSSKGWGMEKPVADSATDEGKAKNRRVEIVKM